MGAPPPYPCNRCICQLVLVVDGHTSGREWPLEDFAHHVIYPLRESVLSSRAQRNPHSGARYQAKNPHSQHVRDIRFGGEVHNNKMERLNGEMRDREKVMRGLKRMDTPILKGYQIYHNFMRPHEGLNGDTPADRAGIKVESENKWLTIIQNAKKDAANGLRSTDMP